MQELTVYRDNERVIGLVTDALNSPHSRRTYRTALLEFFAWWEAEARPLLSRATVQRYKQALLTRGLASSSVNVKLCAIRKLAAEAAANNLLDAQLASGISSVKGVPQTGQRIGNWLSLAEAQAVLDMPDSSLKGKRDRALLALAIGTGLRRSELAGLTFDHIQQREGRWVIVNLAGKGGRTRSVPMPSWCKAAIDAWASAAGITSGRILRAIDKAGKVWGDGVSSQALYKHIKTYARVAPHDLRRTFAKLARKGGSHIEQIMLSLGHASIETTQVYLGLELDLADAPCDHLQLSI